MSYYKTIDGKKMDGQIIDQASLLAKGGSLSAQDAETLLKLVTDGSSITDVEKETVDYIFQNFPWTSGVQDWFRKEMQVWQSHKTPVSMTTAELSKEHFIKVDVLLEPSARATRKHALEAATAETNLDHDEIGLWIRLRDGTTVVVLSNFINLEGESVELRGGCLVPVKAIEKVMI